ncbi:hypothetical protein RB195_012971 [Necator americanus]|uniref:Reverse transcriptase domain-containing protein n=1 Tax=Necator americanus TaxID=51031 RepID=A0ABR1DW50_NECAM
MEIITEGFYSNLSVRQLLCSTTNSLFESTSCYQEHETWYSPRPDFILADFLRAVKERIADQWKTLRTVLIHKKGDREHLRNYRPIYLLSVLYEVFTKIILMRISRTLDGAQSQEQAGFCQCFGCMGYVQSVSRVVELCREHRLLLVLAFLNYEKAFDSIETNSILSALVVESVDAPYVRTLANCYD